MEKVNIVYEGNLRCAAKNKKSADIITDLPREYGGKDEAFSPTELLVTTLMSCMLSMMAMAAKKGGVDIKGTKAEGSKEMISIPERRISSIAVFFEMAKGIPQAMRKTLEDAAHHCPVHKSLRADIKYDIKFNYTD